MSSHTSWTFDGEAAPAEDCSGATAYPDPNAVLERLTDRRRRRILATLLDEGAPIEERELAARIADQEADGEAPDEQSVAIDLHHAHLPALSDMGLVDLDGDDVEVCDHPLLDRPAFRRFLETTADEAVVECLTNERRRAALDALRESDGRMELSDLARAVADDGSVEDAFVSLYHVDVPKLEAAGLIETDGETVVYRGGIDGEATPTGQ